jgi:cyclophilin family peptidyl-prolyl cis-trans isomerase
MTTVALLNRRKFLRSVACVLLLISSIVDGRSNTLAQFRTVFGDIDVELYDQDKPATVSNFIKLVHNGAYQNTFLHRCVPNFVVQGGGFYTLNRLDNNLFTNFYYVPNFGTITNEFGVGPRLTNSYGTIAMARVGGQTNSATSQWFFNLINNSFLDGVDGGFTVFGRVLRGTNILNFFNTISQSNGIVDIRKLYGVTNSTTSLFSDLPVYYYGWVKPRYSDLLYVDISVLNVQIRRMTNGAREISWNSVNSVTNHVEFTTNIPPSWELLFSTNGNGSNLKVIDASTDSIWRFYRVRVNY